MFCVPIVSLARRKEGYVEVLQVVIDGAASASPPRHGDAPRRRFQQIHFAPWILMTTDDNAW